MKYPRSKKYSGHPGSHKLQDTAKYSDQVNKPPGNPGRSIYGGPDRLGHLAQRDGVIDAFDRRGRLIGTFDDVIAAVRAVGGAAAVRR